MDLYSLCEGKVVPLLNQRAVKTYAGAAVKLRAFLDPVGYLIDLPGQLHAPAALPLGENHYGQETVHRIVLNMMARRHIRPLREVELRPSSS